MKMPKDWVSHCPFCGRGWVRQHNYCPNNHSYSTNPNLNELIKLYKNESLLTKNKESE